MKNAVIIFLLVLFTFESIYAQVNNQEDKYSKEDLKIGLVLCGGGAKGAAHIGVLKKLEELRIRPNIVVGTSMGALVGGMYSMGYSASQLDSIVSNADWDFLLSDKTERTNATFSKKANDDIYLINIPFYGTSEDFRQHKEVGIMKNLPGGFISGNNVLNLLNGLAIGYQDSIDFRSLPIPFACVATDLATGEEVVLNKGHIPLALRASMAIPGFFAPVEINGRVLVDGGVVNNFPIDIARQMGADIVIGVDVQSDLYKPEQLKSLDAVFLQLVSLLGNDKFEKNKKDADIYLKPDVSKYGTLSFDKESIAALVKNGYDEATMSEPIFNRLKRKIEGKQYSVENDSYPHRAREVYKSSFKVAKIELEGIPEQDKHWVYDLISFKDSTEITGSQINNAISVLMGTKALSGVTYSLTKTTEDSEWNNLKFVLTPGPTNVISVGARYDTEEAASLLLHIGLNQNNYKGSKFRLSTKLGYNPYLKVGYSRLFKNFPRLEINYKLSNYDFKLYNSEAKKNDVEYVHNQIDIGFANISYFHDFDAKIGIKWQSFNYKFLTEPGHLTSIVPRSARSYFSFYGEQIIDTKDDKSFPNSGGYFDIYLAYYFYAFHKGFKSFVEAKATWEWAINLGSNFVWLPKLYMRTTFNNRYDFPTYNYVGGLERGRYSEYQMPFVGIGSTCMLGNTLSIVRSDLRKQVGKNHYFYLMANYLRTSEKISHYLDNESKNYFGVGLQYTLNTVLGPISANMNWSNYKKRRVGFYLSLGYFF